MGGRGEGNLTGLGDEAESARARRGGAGGGIVMAASWARRRGRGSGFAVG